VNVSVRASIIVSPNSISIEVLQSAAQAIRDELNISDFQVDQPIIIADIISAVINTPGVLSLVNLEFYNMSGNNGDTVYSSFQYDIENATTRGIIIPPPGGIFEVKYPTSDVVVIST
jgi:Co/Zn/Cd efflux system component